MSATQDILRANLLPFLDRAWGLLPPMSHPRVLDIGCGSGVPTLRLAELTDGNVVALDIDEKALEVLRARVDRGGLAHRIAVRLLSLTDLSFEDQSFDLVWCEGALFVLGFRESLRAWRRLLRPGGCLVAHDEAGDVAAKLRAAQNEGYDVLGHLEISEAVWWSEFYGRAEADGEMAEDIRMFQREPSRFRSVYIALRKSA